MIKVAYGDFVVRRCASAYGIGHNPEGGRYVALQGYLAGDRDVIYERCVVHHGRFPADGGLNPEFRELEKRLRDAGFTDVWTAPHL